MAVLPVLMAASCSAGPVSRAAESLLDDAARSGRPIVARGERVVIPASGVGAATQWAESLEASSALSGLGDADKKRVAGWACKAYDAYEVFGARTPEERLNKALLAESGSPGLRLRAKELLSEMKPDQLLLSFYKAGQFAFCESIDAWEG